MELLPKEIIQYICSYLSQFEQITFTRINKFTAQELCPLELRIRDRDVSYLKHYQNVNSVYFINTRLGYNIIVPFLPKLNSLFLGRLDCNITHLTNLKSLTLSTNSNISCEKFNILSLKKLDIRNCKNIKNIFNIGFLTNLEYLSASDTPILTQHLTGLTKLSYLDISHTKVNNIDILTNLTKLSCLNTPLTNITHLTKLKNLALGGRLNKIKEINNLTNLKKLILSRLTSIKEIDKLVNLNTLFMAETEIKNISTLTNLTDLEASGNYSLNDGTLKPLTKLETLSVSSDLDSIQYLTNLDYLLIDVGFGYVNLNSLQKLNTLNLNYTNVQTENIIELVNLKRLSLTKVDDIDLNHFTNLEKLTLSNCKIAPEKYEKIKHLIK